MDRYAICLQPPRSAWRQLGYFSWFTWAALLFWVCMAAAFVIAYRSAPLVTEYANLQRVLKQTKDASPQSPSEFRREFERQAQQLSKPLPLQSSDLRVRRKPASADDSTRAEPLLVAWSYVSDVHLAGLVYLRVRMKSPGYDDAIKSFGDTPTS